MDKKTIETYNQRVKEYDNETIEFWNNFPRSFIEVFVNKVEGKVLNIGSGPARDSEILRDGGLKVICLDASEEMIKISSEKGFESVVGDFLNLPFDNESFSGVWAYTSLLHVSKKDLDKAFEEIKRVLKKGGVFALGLIEGETEEYKESSGVNLPRLFSFYTKEEIEKNLINHGLDVIYFEEFKPRSKTYLNFICLKDN